VSAPSGLAARVLPVLAVHPAGLLTEEIAALIGEPSRKHVVEALRYNEKRGRVSAQRRGQGVTAIWRITAAGADLVRQRSGGARAGKPLSAAGLTAHVWPDPIDGGWVAGCPELPGCFSQGETEGEALRNLTDALAAVISLRAEQGQEDHPHDPELRQAFLLQRQSGPDLATFEDRTDEGSRDGC
jgi:predicted RNase H-like HicB family nuclease